MEGTSENNDDTEEEEMRILEEMKALYQKKIMIRPVVKPTRTTTNYFNNLPDHVLNIILIKVPYKDLFENARRVCKTWRRMITADAFVAQIFLSGRDRLLIGMRPNSLHNDRFLVKEMEITSEDDLEFKLHTFGLSRMGRIRSSCNGMILLNVLKKRMWPTREKGELKVFNPTTRTGFTLPNDFPSGCPHEACCGSVLGFDPNAKVYKVVHIYADNFGFEIADLRSSEELTWRRIPSPWNNLDERPFNVASFSWCDPVSVNNGRYLHWFVDSNQYIVSLDITSEIPTLTYLPYLPHIIRKRKYSLFEFGGFLGFMYAVSNSQLDVWILEDYTKQSWSKKHCIMRELVNYGVSEDPLPSKEFGKLVAVASLNDGKVLVLKHDSCLYLYHLESRVMKKVQMSIKKDMFFIFHRSSLSQWNSVDKDLSLSGLVI